MTRIWKALWGRLHFKIAVGTTVSTTIILFSSFAFFFYSTRQERTNEFYQRARVKVDIVFLSLETAMHYKTPATGRAIVEQLVQRFQDSGEFSHLSVIDKEGNIWVSSDQREEGQKVLNENEMCLPCHIEPQRKIKHASWMVNNTGNLVYRISYAFMNETSCVQCHSPDSSINGVLVADFPMNHFFAALSRELRILVIVLLLSLGTMLLSLRYLLRKIVVSRIQRLSEKTKQIGKGLIPSPLPVQGTDEISNIEYDFNEMSYGLDQQKKKNEVLQQELIYQEKMAVVGQLVAGIAHDFNTPLSVILSRLECIRLDTEDSGLPPRLSKDFTVIERQCKRLTRTVQGLLVFSRQHPLQSEPVDPNLVILEAIDACSPSLEKRNIRLEYMSPMDRYTIRGVPIQLEQMLINLIKNSCDAVKEQGTILLELECVNHHEKRGVRFRIADDGPGFSDEMAHKIFLPFFTTKEAGEGTGLGLAVVTQIVAQHGGTISIGRSRLGGASVEIFVPMHETDIPVNFIQSPLCKSDEREIC